MQFVRTDVSNGIQALTRRLTEALGDGKRTLWLVSGGSNIPITALAMANLPKELTKSLTVLSVDERYGPRGHAESNLHKLINTCRDFKHAKLVPILTNEDLHTTLKRYGEVVRREFQANTAVIAQLGIGADGHIAGILPHSPAADSNLAELAVGYKWSDYVRLTLTFSALERAQTTFVFAYGQDKQPALKQLRDEILPFDAQPAQFLKHIPDVYIYNDQIEQGMR